MGLAIPVNPAQDAEDTDVGSSFFIGDDASERQVVSRKDLLERLSALMRGCEGCEGVAAIGVSRFDKPDSEGCNWSPSIVLDPAGVAPEVYALAYASVIAIARASWNLE